MAYECRKGVKEDPNQDDLLVLITSSFKLFCVTDGHGEDGHFCSDFVKQLLHKLIVLNPNFQSNIEKAFIESFNEIDSMLSLKCENEKLFSNKSSGTTATVVILKDGFLYSANVGDSRAILCSQDEHENIRLIKLTKDHHPDSDIENIRIRNNGGEIRRKNRNSPLRIYSKGNSYPGLAMTRVIGDSNAKNIGIISTPEIYSKNLDANDKFLIICSDGVWEFLSNESASQIVVKNSFNMKVAARNLCEKAYFEWKSNGNSTDDITCLIYNI